MIWTYICKREITASITSEYQLTIKGLRENDVKTAVFETMVIQIYLHINYLWMLKLVDWRWMKRNILT